jgi:two-component system cell cycle sensor histidine kinase/response regulator CckA
MKARVESFPHPLPRPYSPMSLQLSESRSANVSVASSSPSVLLVDDEAAVRVAIRKFLTRRGWTVVEAADGESARAMMEPATGVDFDLVICDLHMPKLSGRDFYRWLAETRPEVALKLVFSTGDAMSPEFAEFLSEAQRPLLPKPFELSELARIVEQVHSPARAA